MICNVKRVAPSCHILSFVSRQFAGANPASATAPHLFLFPTLNFNSQAGPALPAAQSLQIQNTPSPIPSPQLRYKVFRQTADK